MSLERPLPAALPTNRATAVFCIGVCFDPERRVEDLEILVDRRPHRAAAFAMPRPDQPRYDSGFWATVPIPAHTTPGTVRLEARVRLAGGVPETAPLGEIDVVPAEPSPPSAAEPAASEPGGLIAVCMATFEPDAALFETQINSLRAQDDAHWICLISDDCSAPEEFARIEAMVGDDPRFAVSRSPDRLGFYRNFERALSMVPAEAELIALCDQDDRWHPDKLSTLRGALADGDRGALLAYSDQRLVDHHGVSCGRRCGADGATTTTTSARCSSRTRSPAPRPCSGAICSMRCSRFRTRPASSSTITGSASHRSRRDRSRTSSGRCTTTSSTPARSSAT